MQPEFDELEQSMANEQVDIYEFLFEDARPSMIGEANAAYAKHADFKSWRIRLYPEDRAALKKAGYVISTDLKEVIPVVLDKTGRRIQRIILRDGSGRDVRQLNGQRSPVNIVNIGAPAVNEENGPAPLVVVDRVEPAPARKSSDDGGAGFTPGKARLYAKIAKVMGDVNPISERGMSGQGYSYATDADMFNVVRNSMSAANLAMLPVRLLKVRAVEKETFIDLEFTLADGDTGETIVTPWIGKLSNNTDKAIHACMTMCTKYFLKYTFLIATAGDEDADKNKDQSSSKQQYRQQNTQHRNTTPPPASKPAGEAVPPDAAKSGPPQQLADQSAGWSFDEAALMKRTLTWRASSAERINTLRKLYEEGAFAKCPNDDEAIKILAARLETHERKSKKVNSMDLPPDEEPAGEGQS